MSTFIIPHSLTSLLTHKTLEIKLLRRRSNIKLNSFVTVIVKGKVCSYQHMLSIFYCFSFIHEAVRLLFCVKIILKTRFLGKFIFPFYGTGAWEGLSSNWKEGRVRNIPGVNICYFNNLVTSEARPDQTVYCFNANEFEPGALAGQF